MGNQIVLPPGGVVGKPKDRVDGPLKVTGGARYSAEMPIHGVLHAELVTSTIAKGTVKSMDTAEALKQPGVRLVLTPFNAPSLPKPTPTPQSTAPARQQGRVLSLLQDNNVYYNNQPIGVVVADTFEAAQHAASLVRVEYDEQAPTTDMDKERSGIYAQDPNPRPDSQRGDAASAFSSASKKIQQLYKTPIETHNPMEPHATIAVWDGTDKLTVYDSTQGIFGTQSTLARYWQIPRANVRVLTYFVGGGFGCKGESWSQVVLATMAARVANAPVKIALRRQHMFGPVGYRPFTQQTIEAGTDASGKLVGLRHDVYTQTSTFDNFVEPANSPTRMLYDCPNLEATHRLAHLNLGTPTYMRAPGESSGTYALEVAMDEMAYAAGLDPLEFRLKNYAETDPENGKPWSSKSLRECYRVGAERFNWARRTPEPRSMRTPDGMLVGLGLGTATYPAHTSGASARARIMKDGSAQVISGSQDIGTGTYTVMTQVASDAMGIPFEKVTFDLGDTNYPRSPGSGGSTTAASVGSAVLAVGEAVKLKAIQAAIADEKSPLHGLDAADVDASEGRIFSKSSPGKGETYAELIARQGVPYIEETTQSQPDDDRTKYSMHSFGGVFSEVHVDPDLGEIRVARIVGAYGVGNRLNAKTATNQLMGGIVFGIGMALMEETHVDLRNARILNPDLAEYHVPVNADVPRLEVIFIDETDPHVNPLGIKGVGEIGITGVVGSIVNAVYHATGVRVRDLPVTLDKIITA